jgi:TonB family protein
MKNTFCIVIAIFICFSLKAQTSDSVTNKFNKIPYTPFDVFAKFTDGKFEEYIEKNIQYPEGQVQTVNGESVIAFTINEKGKLVNAWLLKNLSPAMDREIIKAFNASPRWTPAILKGENVKVNIGMELMITTDSVAKTIKVTKYKPPVQKFIHDENTIYTSVSNPPVFPGGIDSLHNYLSKSVVYPAELLKRHIGGKVIISFIVEKDGRLTDVKVTRSPNAGLSTEAIRVTQPMKFINGVLNGIPVRVEYLIEVKFDPGNPEIH